MVKNVQFSIDEKGDNSGRQFTGLFQVKTSVSFRESLREDEIRRSLLGVNPESAGPYAASVAAALSYLSVRMVTSPGWWKDANNGAELEDDNILVAINNAALEAINKEREKLNKDAEKATELVRETVAKSE